MEQWAAGFASAHGRLPFSFSLQLTPLACRSSLNVDRQVFLGRPLFLLPSAGVHSIVRRAGHSAAIRMAWPANRNLLSATMSCSRLCPVRASTRNAHQLSTQSKNARRSYCDLTMSNLGAVRHLVFDRNWIFTISWPPRTHGTPA